MKNVLIASTILASLGSVAAAETGVTIGGYGRFGLLYSSEADPSTVIHTRLRLNIDAKTESDSGVTFGGRVRLQNSNGGFGTPGYTDDLGSASSTATSAALLYAAYEGFRVEVGNVNTALDSVELFYDAELGLLDSSYGDSRSSFYAFSSSDSWGSNKSGVYASYSIEGFTVRASYIDPNHYSSTTPVGTDAEASLALTYSTDLFTIAAAATQNGAGIKDNDIYFVGGAYKLNDQTTIGLNYIDEGLKEDDKTVTLYGNYTVDALTLKGYIAYNDADYNDTNTAIGIGADYDLGGAKVTGGIQRGYGDAATGKTETVADVGVRFDF